MRRPRGVGGSRRAIGLGTDLGTKRPICWLQPACRRFRDTHYRCTMSADDAQAELLPVSQRVFENRQVRASRLVMVVIMARWTMASWWSGLVS